MSWYIFQNPIAILVLCSYIVDNAIIMISIDNCCRTPDIELTAVNCTTSNSVLLKWESIESSFGFCVKYDCNADDNVGSCPYQEEVCI